LIRYTTFVVSGPAAFGAQPAAKTAMMVKTVNSITSFFMVLSSINLDENNG